MNDTTKAVLVAAGVPALGGMVGAIPGVLIIAAGTSAQSPGVVIGGSVVAFAGGLVASYYTAKLIKA